MRLQALQQILLLLFSLLLLLFRVSLAAPTTQLRWERLSPDPSSPLPPGRQSMALAFDGIRNQLIVFGGKGSQIFADTWAYNLTDSKWRQLAVGGPAPSARFGMAAGIDQTGGRDRLVISMGEAPGKTFPVDAWQLDLASETWSQIVTTGTPPSGRYGVAGTTYHLQSDYLFVSHGFDNSKRHDDSFILNLATHVWSRVTPDNSPHARCLVSGAVLNDNRLVLWGGCGSGGYGPCPAQDGWVLHTQANSGAQPLESTSQWEQMNTCPRPRLESSMTIAPGHPAGSNAKFVVLFGGKTNTVYSNGEPGEVSILDVDTREWTTIVAAGSAVPSIRYGPRMTYVHNTSSLLPTDYAVVFGGDALNDLWALKYDSSLSPLPTLSCPYIFNLRMFHGLMMFFAFAVIFPTGIFAARFGKKWPDSLWFKIHRPLQMLGVIVTVGGFVAAWLMVASKMRTAHMLIGIIVVAFTFFQPLNAVIRPHKSPDVPPTKLRIVWEYVHKYSGRIVLILGLIQPFQGLMFYNASHAVRALYATWFSIVLFMFIVLTLFGLPSSSPVARAVGFLSRLPLAQRINRWFGEGDGGQTGPASELNQVTKQT